MQDDLVVEYSSLNAHVRLERLWRSCIVCVARIADPGATTHSKVAGTCFPMPPIVSASDCHGIFQLEEAALAMPGVVPLVGHS